MQVAVLGGGGGGHAAAADLTLAGHTVRFWRRSPTGLDALRQAGGITLIDDRAPQRAMPAVLTADMAEAVRGADVIIALLPATAHDELGRRLAPHVEEHQVVVLSPGALGAYVVAREIGRAGKTLPLAVAEMGAPPHCARLTAPTEVRVGARAAHLPVGVFPASRAGLTLPKVTSLFASARPSVDALDAALTHGGPVIHPALVLINAGAIDGGRLDIQTSRATTAGRRLIEAVDAERLATRAGWGYPVPREEEPLSPETAGGIEAHERVSLEHRYVTEDAVLGLSLLESAARTASVDSPAVSGLLLLFGALLGRTLSGHGRALEALGLGELLRREILSLLHEGWSSPLWSRVIK